MHGVDDIADGPDTNTGKQGPAGPAVAMAMEPRIERGVVPDGPEEPYDFSDDELTQQSKRARRDKTSTASGSGIGASAGPEVAASRFAESTVSVAGGRFLIVNRHDGSVPQLASVPCAVC